MNSYWMRTQGMRNAARRKIPFPGMAMSWGVGGTMAELAENVRGLPQVAAQWPKWTSVSVRIKYTKGGKYTKVNAVVKDLEALKAFTDAVADSIEANIAASE
jgi:hypothetical protein